MADKTPAVRNRPLTEMQKLFAIEYPKDFNGKAAAIRAGYAPKNAEITASKLLRHSKVSVEISRNIEERQERVKVDSDYVLARLAQIDKMKIGDILKDGKVMPIEEWPDVWQEMVIGQVDQIPLGDDVNALVLFLNKIKFPDKMKNLELLGKHTDVKAFAEVTKVEHGLTDEAARTIKDVLKSIDGQSTGIRLPAPPPGDSDE